MSVSYTADKLRSKCKRLLARFAPGVTTATLVTLDKQNNAACLPIAQFRRFLAGFIHTTGTGTITSFEIVAATAADGTGATQVVQHALASNPDAVGDFVFLETDVEQIRDALSGATHVGVRIALGTGTDVCTVLAELGGAMFQGAGLTSDYVS